MSFINRLSGKSLALLTVSALTLGGCASAPDESQSQSEAAKAIEPAQTLSPEEIRYAKLVNSDNAFATSKAAATPVPNAVKVGVEQALALKEQGEFAKATEQLTALNQQYPMYSGIALHLGDIALAGNDLKAAKVYYHQAIRINKHNYFAHNRLGSVLRKMGEFEQAGIQYQAAIDSWSGFAPAYLNLGILNDIYQGNKSVALAHYQTYQLLTKNSNRQVKGWIADINAQIKAEQRAKQRAQQQAKQGKANNG